MKAKPPIEVKVGQIWERPNGSRFTIERIDRGYAYYWLAEGSKPQFRSIWLENLRKWYHLMGEKA